MGGITNLGSGILPRRNLRCPARIGAQLAAGKNLSGVSSGDGPVDACFKAIDKITGYKVKLEDFRLEAVTSGKDALGQASLKLKVPGSIVSGRGSSTDIVEAAVKAYIDAVNKIKNK